MLGFRPLSEVFASAKRQKKLQVCEQIGRRRLLTKLCREARALVTAARETGQIKPIISIEKRTR